MKYFYEYLNHTGFVEYDTYHLRTILEMAQQILGNFLEWLP